MLLNIKVNNMKYLVLSMLITGSAIAGFDGANAPGDQQVGGAPMASQTGGLGYSEGKPVGAGTGSNTSSVSTPGQGGMGQGGMGKGDGSGPWGSKGAMGGQRGGGKGK